MDEHIVEVNGKKIAIPERKKPLEKTSGRVKGGAGSPPTTDSSELFRISHGTTNITPADAARRRAERAYEAKAQPRSKPAPPAAVLPKKLMTPSAQPTSTGMVLYPERDPVKKGPTLLARFKGWVTKGKKEGTSPEQESEDLNQGDILAAGQVLADRDEIGFNTGMPTKETTPPPSAPSPEEKEDARISDKAEKLLHTTLEGVSLEGLRAIQLEVEGILYSMHAADKREQLAEMYQELNDLIKEGKEKGAKKMAEEVKVAESHITTGMETPNYAGEEEIKRLEKEFNKLVRGPLETLSAEELKRSLAWLDNLKYANLAPGFKERARQFAKEIKKALRAAEKKVSKMTEQPAVVPEGWTEEKERTLQNLLRIIKTETENLKRDEENLATLLKFRKPATAETQPGVEFFGKKVIEDTIRRLLASNSAIKQVTELSVTGSAESLVLNCKFRAEKFLVRTEVSITNALLVNEGNGIRLADYKLTATKVENKVRDMMDENMDLLNSKLKDFIEKEKGKKVSKISIENGQIKVTYQ